MLQSPLGHMSRARALQWSTLLTATTCSGATRNPAIQGFGCYCNTQRVQGLKLGPDQTLRGMETQNAH